VPVPESSTEGTAEGDATVIAPTEDPQSLTRVRIDAQSLANSFVGDLLNIVGAVTTWLTSTIGGVVGFLFTLLFALFISFLILIDLQNTRRSFVHRIPDAYHREVAIIIRKIITVWNGFLRGQVTLALLIGVVTYLQLLVMGAPGALTLASFTAVISLIPTIGGFIALVPLFILPLLTGSTVMTQTSPLGFALLVILINMLITQFIWNVIAPIILGDVLNLPTPVIILGVFVGGAVGGILGAFLVAPAVSTIIIIVDYLVAKISARDPFPGEEGRIAAEWEVKAIRRQKSKEKAASAGHPAEAN
jgi:predicted PurR-regulated permease PerM